MAVGRDRSLDATFVSVTSARYERGPAAGRYGGRGCFGQMIVYR